MTSKLGMAGSTAMILTPSHPRDLLLTVRLFLQYLRRKINPRKEKLQLAVRFERRLSLRECREMRGDWFTSFISSGRAGNSIGGRNCHRKHVEDG
ncbi:hypothetical protein Csa_019669 [Cucumis sativus]|uniref:Uncharacterized protein n=1 Tax=Cucumis sativus TaxID=3659 RepID=A0A0A0LWM6_CUCSA|nr:hypothetical protein Csa_019669 [Cucumis sativus]